MKHSTATINLSALGDYSIASQTSILLLAGLTIHFQLLSGNYWVGILISEIIFFPTRKNVELERMLREFCIGEPKFFSLRYNHNLQVLYGNFSENFCSMIMKLYYYYFQLASFTAAAMFTEIKYFRQWRFFPLRLQNLPMFHILTSQLELS
jgi:hypothetical protein